MPLDSFDASQFTQPTVWPSGGQTKPSADQSDQWGRKIALTVYDSSNASNSGQGIELTGWVDREPAPICLKVDFRVKKITTQSPNLLYARVYNLNPKTENAVGEFKRISLSAGYKTGRYGQIFDGTIVQFLKGKENATDSYLDIYAGDGDTVLNYAIHSKTYSKGSTNNDWAQGVIDAIKGENQAISAGHVDLGEYGKQKLLRAKSIHQMSRDVLREAANGGNADLFIDDGKINLLARTAYLPGEAAVLNPKTGLIGMPEVTPQGIQARCLLNPNLKLGGLVKIETGVLSGVPFLPGSSTGQPLSQEQAPGGTRFPIATWGAQLSSAFTSPIGTYKILLLEHHGDIRGNPWYSDMVCAALDSSGNIIKSVDLPYSRSIATSPGFQDQ
jgi:hypothetical protein